MTALAGTREAVSFDRASPSPGSAPSRLNAKVIREAEVRQDVAQKNCAEAEMNRTSVAQFCAQGGRRRSVCDAAAPASALSGAPSALFGIAKTTQSSRM